MQPIEIRINLQLDGVNLLCQDIKITPEIAFPGERIVKIILQELGELGVNRGDEHYRSIILQLMGRIIDKKDPRDNLLLLQASDLLNFSTITQHNLAKLARPSRLVDLINFANKAIALLDSPENDLNYAILMNMLEKGTKPIC